MLQLQPYVPLSLASNMLRLADDCRDLNERVKLIETWICSKCNECDMECNLDDLFDDEEDNKDE